MPNAYQVKYYPQSMAYRIHWGMSQSSKLYPVGTYPTAQSAFQQFLSDMQDTRQYRYVDMYTNRLVGCVTLFVAEENGNVIKAS